MPFVSNFLFNWWSFLLQIIVWTLSFSLLLHVTSGQQSSSIAENEPRAERFVAQNSNLQNSAINNQDHRDGGFTNFNSRFRDPQHDSKSKRRYPKYGQSFQSQSYVHDDLPFLLMQEEKSQPGRLSSVLASNYRQTATKIGDSNVVARKYYDEQDDHLGLSKNEERVKIFYDNKPELAPMALRQPGDSFDKPSPYKRMFNSYKTQRAGSIIGKKYGWSSAVFEQA